MQLPARGFAALALLYDLICSYLRCRSASLVEVQPNHRLTEHSSMRQAQQSRIPHAVRRRATVTRASRSKARLRLVTNRRDSWRSHVHRTYIAQRVQFFELQSGNVRGRGGRPLVLSLGGCKGGYSLSRKRVSPFYALSHGAEISRACAEQFANGFVKPFPESLWQHKHRSPMRATANA